MADVLLPVRLSTAEVMWLDGLVTNAAHTASGGIRPDELLARLRAQTAHIDLGPAVPCPYCCTPVVMPFDHAGNPAKEGRCTACGRELLVEWRDSAVTIHVIPTTGATS